MHISIHIGRYRRNRRRSPPTEWTNFGNASRTSTASLGSRARRRTVKSAMPRAEMLDDCCFCAELAGNATEFHAIYPDSETRFILQTRDFVVLPSLGQLTA